MAQSQNISFVIWPSGQVDSRSLTLHGKRAAIEGFIRAYLPSEYFGEASGYVADTLWRSARDNGFRVYTITIGKDGKPVLEKD